MNTKSSFWCQGQTGYHKTNSAALLGGNTKYSGTPEKAQDVEQEAKQIELS